MTKAFEFEDGGRRYSCSIEPRRVVPPESWWWFTVSGDQNRYAPFRAEPKDTQESVRVRVVQYYLDRLERRAQTTETRQHWSQRGKAPAPSAAPVPAAETET
jgi:hypothetical protein